MKSIKLIETKSHRAFNECCLNIDIRKKGYKSG